MRARRVKEEEEEVTEAEEEEEGDMLACLHKLTIETAGTEEETAEGLEAALGISTQEMEVEGDGGIEGEERGRGTQRALKALGLLTQDAEPSGSAH